MKESTGNYLSAALFFLAGASVLSVSHAVSWGLVPVVLCFVVAAAFVVTAIRAQRKGRKTSAGDNA
ncbi:hypothetical protein [Arthrobacter sp. RAF14]|uniref:hypothetical protein n=1 Tax=Arthrobacter sp. RAF14 TaxID=3233051 RepID=UPI003F9315AD